MSSAFRSVRPGPILNSPYCARMVAVTILGGSGHNATATIICLEPRRPHAPQQRPWPYPSPSFAMTKQKQTRFASYADVCVVERLDEQCPRNRLFYSKEEYSCFRRGIMKDVLACRSRRQKGLPMETAAVDTTFGIEQHLGERVDEPRMARSAHCDAIMKAQERAARDELACAEKHLRDVSLSCTSDSVARARFIGIRQSRTT